MNAVILPGKLKGEVTAPPSKSIAHRLLILSAFADRPSVIRNAGNSEDILATLDCLKDSDVLVNGGIRHDGENVILPCRESASTMRFLLPAAAVLRDRVTVHGSKRLLERGIGVYEKCFRENGIRVTVTEKAILTEGRLSAGRYEIPGNISSQYVSGLLLALSVCPGESRLKVTPPAESRPYADMTAALLNQAGAGIRNEGADTYLIRGNAAFHGGETTVEGDWSNAAVLLALNSLGHEVKVNGTQRNSLQGDRLCEWYLQILQGTDAVVDLSDTPDLAPILFAVAASGHGALFTGTQRLAFKESNRSETMIAELAKFGIRCIPGKNSVRVFPGPLITPSGELDGHGDHRIVMALTALCSLTGGVITGVEAVKKSYPDFFDAMKQLGMKIKLTETVCSEGDRDP